jgi:ribose transport system permease protein
VTRAIDRLRGGAPNMVPAPRAEEPTLGGEVGSAALAEPAGDAATVAAPLAAGPTPPVRRVRRTPGVLALFVARNYSLPILLLVSIFIYSFWGKTGSTFNTAASWRQIGSSQSVTGVLTLGILIALTSGNFDLSIGNICGLSSVMAAASFSHWHFPLVAGIAFGIAVGAAVGGMNGFLTTTLRVDPFIITLGTASIILGFMDWYTNGESIINGIPQSLITFGRTNFLGIPKLVLVLALVALAIYYLLEHTPFGRSLHAIGSNRAAAKLVGIRVERNITLAFMLTGAFAGVAGVLLLANTGSGNPTIGPTFTLAALAAAFLGAVSFKVGRLNVPGTVVAIFFLAVNITGLTYAGVSNWITEVFTGATLILAVALVAVLSKERKAKRPTASPSSAEQTRNPA